jgi:hypothetical protein
MMHAAASFGKAWYVAYHDAAIKTRPGDTKKDNSRKVLIVLG